MTNNDEVLLDSPNGPEVTYPSDCDPEDIDLEIPSGWSVDWETTPVECGVERKASPLMRLWTETEQAIRSLRTFAEQHGEMAFVHLCTTALVALGGDDSEAWAVERVNEAIMWGSPVAGDDAEQLMLRSIRAMDCTRPDGAIARGGFQP